MKSDRVLLIDDESGTVGRLSHVISSQGYTVEQKKTLDLAGNSRPSFIVLSIANVTLPRLNIIAEASKLIPRVPVILVVAPSQIEVVIQALRLGAAEILVAPIEATDLLRAISNLDEQFATRNAVAPYPGCPPQEHSESSVLISRSPKMSQIWNVAKTVAHADVPVLILGESGVGKEVFARYIHRNSLRAGHPLIKVNCAALPHDLLESELFGYERGAFTGAVGEKPGKFELADKGCIILDEIGEMAPSLQAKLLHVLEDGEFSRLGGKRSVKVDVRVIALTNRRLEEAVPRGEFRGDLYFRLNVIKLKIPPLRERAEDIPMLCDFFLKKHREALGSAISQLPMELVDVFTRYDWPGNVRQLENTVKRYLILPDLDMDLNGETRTNEPVPAERAAAAVASAHPIDFRAPIAFPKPEDNLCLKTVVATAVERTERELILHVLEQSKWNRSIAARRLNICYKGLLNKLKKWQLPRGA